MSCVNCGVSAPFFVSDFGLGNDVFICEDCQEGFDQETREEEETED